MSDENRTGSAEGPPEGQFPSRRSIHASRIPSRQGRQTAPQPIVSAGPAEKKSTPKTSPPADGGKSSSRAAQTAAPPSGTVRPGNPSSPFPTRRQHLTETGALPLAGAAKRRGANAKGTDKNRSAPAPSKQPSPASTPSAQSTAFPTAPVQSASTKQSASKQPAAPSPRAPLQVKAKRTPGWRVALVLLIVLGLVGGALFIAWRSLSPTSTTGVTQSLDFPGPGTGSVEVTVEPGEVGSQIGQTLVDAGVVKTVEGFVRAFDATAAASMIKPGTYTLQEGMTSAAALAALLDEANRQDNAITVNAGQTAEQIYAKMISVGGFTQDAIDNALADPQALGLPEVAGGNVEGWLAVGSYDFGSDIDATEALSTMIDRTKTILTDLGAPEDEWENILIKASILEREVGLESDMPKVARVIVNRLSNPDAETRGLLQMDSTVLYGVGKFGGLPTSEDLGSDSPYNTYLVKGLPPTPIASPSLAAIEATISPADGDWLYFVTVNLDTGETLFASNLEEQTANIEQLKAWCTDNEGRC